MGQTTQRGWRHWGTLKAWIEVDRARAGQPAGASPLSHVSQVRSESWQTYQCNNKLRQWQKLYFMNVHNVIHYIPPASYLLHKLVNFSTVAYENAANLVSLWFKAFVPKGMAYDGTVQTKLGLSWSLGRARGAYNATIHNESANYTSWRPSTPTDTHGQLLPLPASHSPNRWLIAH